MKKNFLPSQAFNGLFKKAYKGCLVLALTLTIAVNSFAHTAQPFVFGCVTPGQNMTIDAVITNAGAQTYYQWQFRDNSGNWKCFVNGTNTINGVNFIVSGATSALVANDAPLLTINAVTTALENVFVRVLMRHNAYPVCVSSASGHTNTGDTYGGDDQALNETKYLRLHVFASATICPPNAYACAGNILVNAGAYYGGFEAVTFNAGTNAYTSTNFAAGNGSTDYTLGAGTTNKTYQDINNPYAKSATYTRNIAPHTGNYQMVVEGSGTTSTATDRVWYKTTGITNGTQYRFDVWVVKIDATNPIIELRAGTQVLATVDMTSIAVGTWKLVHGTYTATTTNASFVFSVRETTGSKNFALDDICLSVCTNCAALPLHQLELRSYLQGNNVSLKWVAENEMGTESFVVERSTDGVNFSQIASRAPSGPLNTPTEYQQSDDIQSLSSASVVYYRIKAIDREGRIAYSNIATVRLNKTAGVQVWPNPFGDFVNITYNSSASTKVDVSVVNSLGKVVKQSNYSVSRGLNQISVNGLETLSSGIYFIRITDKNTNEVYIQKISK